MSWLAFLLSACGVFVGSLTIGNLVVGLVVAYGFMRGNRCTEHDDLVAALAMIFFGVPFCAALTALCWWAGGQITG